MPLAGCMCPKDRAKSPWRWPLALAFTGLLVTACIDDSREIRGPAAASAGGGQDAGAGNSAADTGGPWTLLVEAESFGGNEFWTVCPGPGCENDRGSGASGGGHLLTHALKSTAAEEGALHQQIEFPRAGAYFIWALSVRAGERRTWSVSLGDSEPEVVGEEDAGRWERAGEHALETTEAKLSIRDAAADIYWSYPDAILLTDDPRYDPNGAGVGESGEERDTRCDDDEGLSCDDDAPRCGRSELLAIRDGCWLCVDPRSCEAPEEPVNVCEEEGGYCVGWRGSCRGGEDRRRGMGCPDRGARCCIRSTDCDDGTDLACLRDEPECDDGEALAIQEGCWVCVHEDTCRAWGAPGCEADRDCPATHWCDPCGASSCPDCDDCVTDCSSFDCRSEDALDCILVRLDCAEGASAVIQDGCWVCVDRRSCEPVD